MRSPGNARKPQIGPVSLKLTPKGGKLTDRPYNLISSEDGQDTSASNISGHNLHALSGRCPETCPNGRTDGQAEKRSRLVG